MTNKQFFQARYGMEGDTSARVLAAVPGDKLAWRPHERSRSAEELIGHLIGHEQDLAELLDRGTINHRMQVPFGSMNEAIALFKEAHAAVEQKLAGVGDGAWDDGKGQFLVQGKVVMEAPCRDLAWLLFFDSVHHRGQLSTYLRPMGGKVPAIYGPSGDAAP